MRYNSPVFETYCYPSGHGQYRRPDDANTILGSNSPLGGRGGQWVSQLFEPERENHAAYADPYAFWSVFVDANGNPIGAAIDEVDIRKSTVSVDVPVRQFNAGRSRREFRGHHDERYLDVSVQQRVSVLWRETLITAAFWGITRTILSRESRVTEIA